MATIHEMEYLKGRVDSLTKLVLDEEMSRTNLIMAGGICDELVKTIEQLLKR